VTHLVSHYEDKPVDLKGKVELAQYPMTSAAQLRSSEGAVQPGVVYVVVPSPVARPLLVPFGAYDEWSLRDRYNEAIRIMNTLGTSTIVCESYRAVSKRSRLRLLIGGKGGEAAYQRVDNSGFDFRHVGTGSLPRDPSPLRWPDEPGFAAAIVSVLANRATQVSMNIRSSNGFDVHSSLGASLQNLGFELGGGHLKTDIASLHITAQFPTPPKKGWL
jgi:hypothetical protein